MCYYNNNVSKDVNLIPIQSYHFKFTFQNRHKFFKLQSCLIQLNSFTWLKHCYKSNSFKFKRTHYIKTNIRPEYSLGPIASEVPQAFSTYCLKNSQYVNFKPL